MFHEDVRSDVQKEIAFSAQMAHWISCYTQEVNKCDRDDSSQNNYIDIDRDGCIYLDIFNLTEALRGSAA